MEKIITSVPADSTAARVTSKGYQFKTKKNITCFHTDILPEVKEKSIGVKEDPIGLIGKRFGWFEVIGLSVQFPKRWIVRCDCGYYEARTAKAIRNENNQEDRCHMCRHIQEMNRCHEFRTLGYNKDDKKPKIVGREVKITIDGTEITNEMVMTIKVALGHFELDLSSQGLGNDEHGKQITKLYKARVREINSLLYK